MRKLLFALMLLPAFLFGQDCPGITTETDEYTNETEVWSKPGVLINANYQKVWYSFSAEDKEYVTLTFTFTGKQVAEVIKPTETLYLKLENGDVLKFHDPELKVGKTAGVVGYEDYYFHILLDEAQNKLLRTTKVAGIKWHRFEGKPKPKRAQNFQKNLICVAATQMKTFQ